MKRVRAVTETLEQLFEGLVDDFATKNQDADRNAALALGTQLLSASGFEKKVGKLADKQLHVAYFHMLADNIGAIDKLAAGAQNHFWAAFGNFLSLAPDRIKGGVKAALQMGDPDTTSPASLGASASPASPPPAGEIFMFLDGSGKLLIPGRKNEAAKRVIERAAKNKVPLTGLVAKYPNGKPLWLDKIDLSGAIFDGADLRGVVFTKTVLKGASFKGAECTGAVFTGADLSGADVTGAKNLDTSDMAQKP